MNTDLPEWKQLLVVVAHPDDESFGLGAVIDAFVNHGTRVHVLCLTRGEASTLGADAGDLGAVRALELKEAGRRLGVAGTTLAAWPDGDLAFSPHDAVMADITSAINEFQPDGLLVFEPTGVTGHPDHAAATALALEAAQRRNLPVLAWTLPAEVAATINVEFDTHLHGDDAVDVDLPVARDRQRAAIYAHASQAVPGSLLWRRLELLGDHEVLIWLRQAG